LEKIIATIFDSIAHGGPDAIFMILLSVIGALIYDRINLIKSLKDSSTTYRTDISAVVTKYQEGQISVIVALNEIKLILVKIEAKV
jgi:hypothetical protein